MGWTGFSLKQLVRTVADELAKQMVDESRFSAADIAGKRITFCCPDILALSRTESDRIRPLARASIALLPCSDKPAQKMLPNWMLEGTDCEVVSSAEHGIAIRGIRMLSDGPDFEWHWQFDVQGEVTA